MKLGLLKKTTALILAAAMLFVSVACTSQGNTNSVPTGRENSSSGNSSSSQNTGSILPEKSASQGGANSSQNAGNSSNSIILEYDDLSYDPPVTHEPANVLYKGAIEYDDSHLGPVKISGLKDRAVQDKINAAIEAEYARLSDPSFLPDVTGIKILKDRFDQEPFVYCMVSGNIYNILSVACIYRRNISQYYDYYGYTNYRSIGEHSYLNFDLKTGELIALEDVFIDGVDPVKYINSRLINEIMSDTSATDFMGDSLASLISKFRGIREDQPFYISNNGGLVICLDSKNREFELSSGPVIYEIDISRVSALESRFGQTEGVYENDETQYYLWSHNPEGEYEKVSLDIYPEILDLSYGWYYSNVSIVTYKALTSGQNDYLSFADIGLEKLAAQINADYDADCIQDDPEYAFMVHANSRASCQGEYINCSRSIYEYSNGGKEEIYNTYLNIYERRVYRQGEDEPLKISDLFVDKSDWEVLLKAAMLKRLERENEYYRLEIDASDPFIAEFYDQLIDNTDETGFTVNSNSLFFDYEYSETNALAESLFIDTPLMESRDYITECFGEVFFSDIGYGNLVVFK